MKTKLIVERWVDKKLINMIRHSRFSCLERAQLSVDFNISKGAGKNWKWQLWDFEKDIKNAKAEILPIRDKLDSVRRRITLTTGHEPI